MTRMQSFIFLMVSLLYFKVYSFDIRTSYGKVTFDSTNCSVSLDSKLFNVPQKICQDQFRFLKIFKFPKEDRLLMASNCGGTGCPEDDLFFLTVDQKKEVHFSEIFDSFESSKWSKLNVAKELNNIKVEIDKPGPDLAQYIFDGKNIKKTLVTKSECLPEKILKNKVLVCFCQPDKEESLWQTSLDESDKSKKDFKITLKRKHGGTPEVGTVEIVGSHKMSIISKSLKNTPLDRLEASYPADFLNPVNLKAGNYTLIWRSENKKIICDEIKL